MLEDIREITRFVFDTFEPENKALSNPKICHNVYRKLALLTGKANFIAEYHLSIDLAHEISTNSSLSGAIFDWRHLFNGELEALNVLTKDYLQELTLLSLKDPSCNNHSLVGKKYNMMYFYFFVKERYNVGYIDPCDFMLTSLILNPKIHDNQNFDMANPSMLNLADGKSRVALQNHLRNIKKLLDVELERLKRYMVKNYTLEMVL